MQFICWNHQRTPLRVLYNLFKTPNLRYANIPPYKNNKIKLPKIPDEQDWKMKNCMTHKHFFFFDSIKISLMYLREKLGSFKDYPIFWTSKVLYKWLILLLLSIIPWRAPVLKSMEILHYKQQHKHRSHWNHRYHNEIKQNIAI